MPNIAFSTLRKAAQASFYLKNRLKKKTPQAARLLNDYLKADTGFLKKFDQIKNPAEQKTKFSPISEDSILTFFKKIWNEDPRNIIGELEINKAEGSIAYIYFSRLKTDGCEVALKVLKPDIENEIYTLTKLLNFLPEVSFLKKWNFPFESYKTEISERMLVECDFNNEILNNKLAQALKGTCPVEYPHIYLQYSSRQLLCMSKMEGKPLYFLKDELTESQKKEVAKELFETFLHQLIKTGFFQSDWNPGNILYDAKNKKLQMIDFGSWIELNQQEQDALSQLITTRSRDADVIIGYLTALGFSKDHLFQIKSSLPRLIEILINPIFHASSVDLNTWNPGQLLNNELGDLKWWFRSAGPAKGVFLIRAFHGFLSHLKALNIKIDFMMAFDEKPPAEVTTAKDTETSSLLAKQLHIELTDFNNKPLVSLSFPIHTIYNIKELIGDSLYQKIIDSHIDIEILISNFITAGGPTGPFLNTETKDRRVRVWTT